MGVSIKEFKIEYDGGHLNAEKQRIFRVGEKLVGRIIISGVISNISGLKLILVGRAKSYWRELDAENMSMEFNDEEQYILLDVDLEIEESIKSRKEYSFEFNVPHGLPTSFEGLYGDLTYSLIARLGVDRQTITRSIQKEFKLQGQLNLREYPQIMEPVEIDVTKHMLFGIGSLGLDAKLRSGGYVPGDFVELMMKFRNECPSQIQVNLFLIRETTYHAGESKIIHTEILESVQGPAVESQKEESWEGKLIQIPVNCSPVLENCKLIELQYKFLIEMDIPGPHMNLEATLPITIGTVPSDGDSSFDISRVPIVDDEEIDEEIDDPSIEIPEEREVEAVDTVEVPTEPEAPENDVTPTEPEISEPEAEPVETPSATPAEPEGPAPEGTPTPTPTEPEGSVPAETPNTTPEVPVLPEKPETGAQLPAQQDTTPANPQNEEPANDDSFTITEVTEDSTPKLPKVNRSKFRARNQRAHTTTNVFRPVPVKQILPSPKPETWTTEDKPSALAETNVPNAEPVVDILNNENNIVIPNNDDDEITATAPTETPIPELPEEPIIQTQNNNKDNNNRKCGKPQKMKRVEKKPVEKCTPYPTVFDSNLFPKPMKKIFVNIYKVAENKVLIPIGWKVKKSRCGIAKVGCPSAPGFIIATPCAEWSKE